MKSTDYYRILGVPRHASGDDIKQAFRRLARRYHPDVSEETGAEEMFKLLSEAYEVLGDRNRRAAYDRSTPHDYERHGHASAADWAPRRRRSSFDFEAGAVWTTGASSPDANGHPHHGRHAHQAGDGAKPHTHFDRVGARDLETSVIVTVEEVCHGAERTLDVAGCGPVRVVIPAGVMQGQTLRMAGMGPPGPEGRSGDLYVHVHITPHDLYRVKDKTIVLDLPVTPWEAALGASLKIPTPYGRLRVRVPPGATSGQSLRLRGRGLPAADGNGDLFVQIKIVLPPEMSEAELDLYRQLEALNSFDPRAHFPKP
ncbi:MAG: DnaJ C-terminal domain-containing protein [Thiobacillaceae bacterium]